MSDVTTTDAPASGADAPLTVILGDEHDAGLRSAVSQALKRLGATEEARRWGVGGSQELEVFEVKVQGARLSLEAETFVGLSASGPTWLVQRLQAFVNDALPPVPSAAPLASPRYVIVGLRPACALPTPEGGLDVLVYDWDSGELVRDMSWLSIVLGHTDKDLDVVSEGEFEDRLARLRAAR